MLTRRLKHASVEGSRTRQAVYEKRSAQVQELNITRSIKSFAAITRAKRPTIDHTAGLLISNPCGSSAENQGLDYSY